jgi:hypothetical protein
VYVFDAGESRFCGHSGKGRYCMNFCKGLLVLGFSGMKNKEKIIGTELFDHPWMFSFWNEISKKS